MSMSNEDLKVCIEAEMRGEKIQCKRHGETGWMRKVHDGWNTQIFDYLIAKPEPKLVPHWPVIRLNGNNHYYLSDYIFPDEQSAKALFANFVRLATEYPPIMLEETT